MSVIFLFQRSSASGTDECNAIECLCIVLNTVENLYILHLQSNCKLTSEHNDSGCTHASTTFIAADTTWLGIRMVGVGIPVEWQRPVIPFRRYIFHISAWIQAVLSEVLVVLQNLLRRVRL
jgi:hypothetical protein